MSTQEWKDNNPDKIRKSRCEWYARNREKAKASIKKRSEEIKEWFAELKTGLSCSSCGCKDHRVLEFHHRDPGTKKENISKMVIDGFGREKILKEIDKCDVLCANCHRILHYEQRANGQ